MKYIIRASDGSEYGPVDQDVILSWVEDGRITHDTDIRNTLMKTWTKAGKLPFVADLLLERARAAASESGEVEDEGNFAGPREAVHSLNQAGRGKFQPAAPFQRIFAWLFDVVATVGISSAAFVAIILLWEEIGDPLNGQLVLIASVLAVGWFFLYYTLGLGFKAQTFGQWFWGVMIIKSDGGPVYAGRAFIYTLLYIFLWPTTFFFYAIVPGRRSLQELLSNTRIIKITLR